MQSNLGGVIMSGFSENAKTILTRRYYAPGESEPEHLFKRVAKAVAEAEDTQEQKDYWAGTYYDLMLERKFLPNSPTLVNAGLGKGCLSACFVVSPEDTLYSIMQTAYDAAMIEKWGGGIGFGLSNLRPEGDKISTTHGHAIGPIGAMEIYSTVGGLITQGAFRMGAHMAQLHCTHPQIFDFIDCKSDGKRFTNFNISVQLTDEFMRAVESDGPTHLINPHDGRQVGSYSARIIFRRLCEEAWRTGDPGVVFIDRIRGTEPNPHLGLIQSTNPCGEEPLENYNSCNLGSLNLSVKLNPADVQAAVRFLD